jgi:hypothetical protein
MRWLRFLTLADGDPAAQQRVVDTALSVVGQTDHSRFQACVASSVPTPQSLCELLDAFGIVVSDHPAQDLGIASLGVEAAGLVEQRSHGLRAEPVRASMGY